MALDRIALIDGLLSARVEYLLNRMRKSGDPRLKEIIEVMSHRELHTSGTRTSRHERHTAVFMYVEENHPDLYGIIQNAYTHLNRNLLN